MNTFTTKAKTVAVSVLALGIAGALAGIGIMVLGVLAAFALAACALAVLAAPFLPEVKEAE